jgi:hypothetical protein
MNRRVISIVIGASLALGVGAGTVSAADPAGTGQPGQSCQAEPTGPAGLLSATNGFATHAVHVYAGSPGTPSLANGNAHAVSQYDVACFQVSTHRPS